MDGIVLPDLSNSIVQLLKSQCPATQKVTRVGDKVFEKTSRLMKPSMKSAGCPHVKRKSGLPKTHQRHVRTEERLYKDPVRRQPCEAKERGLRRNQTCQHLCLRLLASRTMTKKISVICE